MTKRLFAMTTTLLGLTGITTITPTTATADSCAAVDVSFARGRDEPPGIGRVGQAFVDALQPRVRSMTVYPVDYSAGLLSTGDGAADLNNHLSDIAGSCPNTKLVIGGYSMGATVVDSVIGVGGAGNPMPPDIGNRVRGIATFGNITHRDGPLSQIGGAYASRAIDLCNPGDPICQSGDSSFAAHTDYETTSLPSQAAAFVAGKL